MTEDTITRIREIRRGLQSTPHGREFLATAARREGFPVDDEGTLIIRLADAGWTWDEICFING
jgi:hypothetical protein